MAIDTLRSLLIPPVPLIALLIRLIRPISLLITSSIVAIPLLSISLYLSSNNTSVSSSIIYDIDSQLHNVASYYNINNNNYNVVNYIQLLKEDNGNNTQ